MLPLQVTPVNNRIKLKWPEIKVSGLHFAANFRSFVEVNSRSTKVVDFGTNPKRVRDFLLVINSNLGPILHHFGYGGL